MKTEKQIKKHIKELEASVKGQISHAELRKGDGHDQTREKAILVREGYLSGLRWVLK